jgi:hypothetical protein
VNRKITMSGRPTVDHEEPQAGTKRPSWNSQP